MAIITNLQVQCQEGKGPEFLALAKELLPVTRAYDGCNEYNLCVNPENSDHIELFGKWDSKAHFDKYFQWRVDTGAFEAMAPFVEGDPVIRAFDVDTVY